VDILIVTGPTGVGKSSFVDKFAQTVPSEIVNIDVGQLYAPLRIGTAKPDLTGVTEPHHLFDLLDEPRSLTVTEYRRRLKEIVEDILQRGRLPILVGGSGFYINSLFFPPQAVMPVQESSEASFNDNNSEGLWDQLYKIDPVRAGQIHRHDTYRVNRALDIWKQEGVLPSKCKPTFDPIASAVIAFVGRDRPELYDRINTRTHEMIDEGWIEEVKKLQGTSWEPFLRHKKLIGYDDIFQYLDTPESERDQHKLIELIQKRTRHYAKRQCAYNSMLIKKLDAQNSSDILIQEINLSQSPSLINFEKLLIALNKQKKERNDGNK
jgi:tRNA dimethylallyltransferase